jgi:hypothetical protein
MTNRDLKNIIQQIQTKEGIDLTEIAAKVDINRSYLSSFINNKTLKPVTPVYIGKFTKHFPSYFQGSKKDQQKTTETGSADKLDDIIASLIELQGYTISILTGQSAGNEVIMGALDRLEKNPVGSLSSAADKLALQLAERLSMIQTGKKAGAHKPRT